MTAPLAMISIALAGLGSLDVGGPSGDECHIRPTSKSRQLSFVDVTTDCLRDDRNEPALRRDDGFLVVRRQDRVIGFQDVFYNRLPSSGRQTFPILPQKSDELESRLWSADLDRQSVRWPTESRWPRKASTTRGRFLAA